MFAPSEAGAPARGATLCPPPRKLSPGNARRPAPTVLTGAPSAEAIAPAPLAAEQKRPRSLDRRLAIAIFVVALIGVGVATYLTYIHYAGIKPICAAGGGGCEKVQSSVYSKLAGIPVAVLGLAGYLAILGSLLVRGDSGRLAGALIALCGFGFSAYLTYREVFSIKAICQWCVGSAVLMTILALLTMIRLLRAPPELESGAAPASDA